jgi:glucosamine--fructose-6-phosphate aminotransferase (isomerizing)
MMEQQEEPTAGQLMRRDMDEQPDVLANLIRNAGEVAERIGPIMSSEVRGIALIARGSSDRAALYGRYILEVAARVPVVPVAPSIYTKYKVRSRFSHFLAVAVSQSGRTEEIVQVAELLRSFGACSIVMTNDPTSPIADAGDAVIDLAAGPERAVPATKTVVAELLAFGLLAQAIGDVPWGDADLGRLPALVHEVLADWDAPAVAAHRLRQEQRAVAVGRGYVYSAAMETALKLEESALLLTEGFSAAEFRHGPIALLRRRVPVVAFSAPGPVERDVTTIADEAEARGGSVIRVSSRPDADLFFPALPEALAPIPAIVRGQQLAWAVATGRGLDPDRPPGLSKITSS